MIWRVGLLYRLGDLLEMLGAQEGSYGTSLDGFSVYQGVRMSDLLTLASVGGWTEETASGSFVLTPAGHRLVRTVGLAARLRMAVMTLVAKTVPAWGAAAIQGRKALANYAPPEAVQCFGECGLLDSCEPEVIRWWDDLSARYRAHRDSSRTATGRSGESLSVRFERERTGHDPYWIALDFSGAGFDIQSRVSRDDARRLVIEVKASERSVEGARFHLSRNEWEVLEQEEHAILHLWRLEGRSAELRLVSRETLRPHAPRDTGDGRWEEMTCQFVSFEVVTCVPMQCDT